MDHQLVIDSDVVYALATELSQLTGKSVAEAVTAALQDRVVREREIAARIERVNRIVDEMQEHWVSPGSSKDIDDLYGEDGLPV